MLVKIRHCITLLPCFLLMSSIFYTLIQVVQKLASDRDHLKRRLVRKDLNQLLIEERLQLIKETEYLEAIKKQKQAKNRLSRESPEEKDDFNFNQHDRDDSLSDAISMTHSAHKFNASLPFCDSLFKIEILNNQTFDSKIIEVNKTSNSGNYKTGHLYLDDNPENLQKLVNSTGIKSGCWSPCNYCNVRQSIAIVVPFRNRYSHSIPFLIHMHKFLQKQHREYCIFFAEQTDQGQFNRGKLFNVGFDYIMKEHPVYQNVNLLNKKPDCFIFADVDLLPENLRNLYGCLSYSSNHLCDKFNKFRYETQFIAGKTVSSGGVVAIPTSQYVKTNGHPNRYYGWGLEDHDMSMSTGQDTPPNFVVYRFFSNWIFGLFY